MSEELKNSSIFVPDSPELLRAKERAGRIVESAQLNEAIKIVEQLLKEVATMHIAKRFRPDQKIFSDVTEPANLNPRLRGLSESEHKREQLERNLRHIADQITLLIAALEDTVLDIEATKTEG